MNGWGRLYRVNRPDEQRKRWSKLRNQRYYIMPGQWAVDNMKGKDVQLKIVAHLSLYGYNEHKGSVYGTKGKTHKEA